MKSQSASIRARASGSPARRLISRPSMTSTAPVMVRTVEPSSRTAWMRMLASISLSGGAGRCAAR
ncbi:MAG: hypothetical protein C4523_08745 [Myxococcales bacterium]|nr:MAG: hypothetical protein C4523_08745 [Myxococcales bacterium]